MCGIVSEGQGESYDVDEIASIQAIEEEVQCKKNQIHEILQESAKQTQNNQVVLQNNAKQMQKSQIVLQNKANRMQKSTKFVKDLTSDEILLSKVDRMHRNGEVVEDFRCDESSALNQKQLGDIDRESEHIQQRKKQRINRDIKIDDRDLVKESLAGIHRLLGEENFNVLMNSTDLNYKMEYELMILKREILLLRWYLSEGFSRPNTNEHRNRTDFHSNSETDRVCDVDLMLSAYKWSCSSTSTDEFWISPWNSTQNCTIRNGNLIQKRSTLQSLFAIASSTLCVDNEIAIEAPNGKETQVLDKLSATLHTITKEIHQMVPNDDFNIIDRDCIAFSVRNLFCSARN